MKTPLLVLAALSLLAAGCTGGGGGGGGNQAVPCCGATGATEAPASFAPSTTRFAQPILFTTTSDCIALANPNVLALPPFTEVGEAVPVDVATGRYSVAIDESGEGQDVAIRIFDDGDPVVERGIALLPAAPSADAALPYEVVPIRFTAGSIGESTLEVGVFCAMRNETLGGGLQGNLTFADVRAAITSEVADAYVMTAGTGALGVAAHVGRYRHGVNGIANQIPAGQRAIFAEIRRSAEEEADRVRSLNDGSELAEAQAALARFRAIVSASPELAGVGLPQEPFKHLHAWAQDVIEELETATGPASDSRFESFRTLQLLRFAIAENRILAAATQSAELDLRPDLPDSFGETVHTLLARLESDLFNAVSLPGFANAWDRFAAGLIGNAADNNPARSVEIQTAISDVDPVANTFVALDLSDSVAWTHLNLALRLYGGDGGSIPGAWADMRVEMDQIAIPAADRDRLNDFFFYSKINKVAP